MNGFIGVYGHWVMPCPPLFSGGHFHLNPISQLSAALSLLIVPQPAPLCPKLHWFAHNTYESLTGFEPSSMANA